MIRYSLLVSSAVISLLAFTACKKSDKTNDSRTMANVAGSYGLVALTASGGGASLNLYDSLPACERDNVIALDANGGAQFIDAQVVCIPPSDSTGSWHLSAKGDSLYLGNEAGLIKSFDGKTLVLVNAQLFSGFTVVATTTLAKQ